MRKTFFLELLLEHFIIYDEKINVKLRIDFIFLICKILMRRKITFIGSKFQVTYKKIIVYFINI